jgi:RHS repeat-associated protein
VIENQSQQVVWRWDNDDPFGANMANSNPSGLGAFTFNLRLPGQYFDKETNLHYNYFRDYSPEIGRYLQSDPIGLFGGLNTYAYVENKPVLLMDPQGLQIAIPGGAGSLGGIGKTSPIRGRTRETDPMNSILTPQQSKQPSSFWPTWLTPKQTLEECEQECDDDYDDGVVDCEWRWKMRGRQSNDYRECMNNVRSKYIKCYQNCKSNCSL